MNQGLLLATRQSDAAGLPGPSRHLVKPGSSVLFAGTMGALTTSPKLQLELKVNKVLVNHHDSLIRPY